MHRCGTHYLMLQLLDDLGMTVSGAKNKKMDLEVINFEENCDTSLVQVVLFLGKTSKHLCAKIMDLMDLNFEISLRPKEK